MQPIGSGFLIGRGSDVFAITCAHVLVKAGQPEAKIENVAIGLLREDNAIAVVAPSHGSIDQTNDIAVLKVPQMGLRLLNSYFHEGQIGSSDDIKEGRGVLFAGYPLQRGLEVVTVHTNSVLTNAPVFRIGIVARRPLHDQFLIDGASSPGNSGSLVFDLQKATIVGMVTGHLTEPITLLTERRQHVASLPYNSGLGTAVSIEAIRRILREVGFLSPTP
jgi:S1-C subfamily serine protease